MARKNLLAGLTESTEEPATSNYRIGGASKSMIRSVNELARQADAFLEGEQVVDLDPNVIDSSFVSDRLGTDGEEYQQLLQAIQERGQDSPILVRPHPSIDGRFMIVFGHRRVKVARELGRNVRAVVKALDDKTHIIAQGQENSARANLSFIEKALFAKNLETLGYDRETISSALAANAAAVSKMISVTSRISPQLVNIIGSAPGVGRERWLELSLLVERKAAAISEIVTSDDFGSIDSDERFNRVFTAANAKGKPVKKERTTPTAKSWGSSEFAITMSQKPKQVDFSFKSEKARPFGDWLSERLEILFEEFKQSETKNGD
ncbi:MULTISPECIES: plasmid partitioning protein RepB [Brucella]|uniref:Plasmid partitioning protein RepB n=1 Tax=Brucella rhizosphaerae TaxID=571254 RepID=A0A256FRR7_9HYPH|nr:MULTISPECIES: plasmid partitioning protein RepB [Brucella]MCR5944211.1 plasmid partitioning protein RepB [Ochrobactrum sp. XJ1]OYR17549.1 plasmid partitioning protein RepB [Brucella rhizosphaerae]UVV71023.1 plasmid partitioning protein RepB [Brucella anthropi]